MGGERTLQAFYFCYFAAIGVTEPFLPVFFRERGFSPTAIGGLLALVPAVQATLPFAFTTVAEARGLARPLFRIAAAGTVVAFAAFALPGPVWVLALVMLVYAALKSPLIPFANAMAFTLLQAERERFGRLRVFGSLGYIVAAVAVGFALEAVGARVILLAAGLAFLAAAAAATAPLPEPTLRGARLRKAWGELLRNRALCWFLAASLLVRISGGAHLTFFTLYLRERGIGEGLAGVAWGVGVAAEVAVMLAWPSLSRRVPVRLLLALGFGATAVRWVAVSLTASPAALVLIQSLHALTFGVTYLASVHLIDSEVPPALRASGQALYAAVAFGLAGLLGHSLAGLLAEHLALGTLFRLSGLLALLGTVLFLATVRVPAAAPTPAPAPRSSGEATMTRAEAWALLTEHTQSESLIRHALAVEAAMRAYARRFGTDEELWGIVGLLHDFDYERWPDPKDHPTRGAGILREKGVSEEVITAILSHAEYLGIPRTTPAMKTLFAVDELCGFLTAAALIRPSRSILDLEASSVRKRMKDKAFARNVKREDIVRGAAELGIPLDEHLQFVIGAMRGIADQLGLRGNAGGEDEGSRGPAAG